MLPTCPEPRRECAVWVYNDWLYVFGGVSNSVQTSSGALNEAHRFNAYTFPTMWRFHLPDKRCAAWAGAAKRSLVAGRQAGRSGLA